jgi:hypothetical protein
MPRSTAYSILEGLIGRRVITTDRQSGTTYYLFEQAEFLRHMVERQRSDAEQEYKERSAVATELAELVSSYYPGALYNVPRMQFFEGTDAVRKMLFEHCSKWQKSVASSDYTWWGYQDHQLVELFPDFIHYHGRVMAEDERVSLFSNQSTIEDQMKGKIVRRQIRLAPEGSEFSSTVWIMGEYVVTIMLRQKPHYAFELQDAVFAANQRTVFQLLWQLYPQAESR